MERGAVSENTGEGQRIVPEYTANSGGAHLLGVESQVRYGHANAAELIKLDEGCESKSVGTQDETSDHTPTLLHQAHDPGRYGSNNKYHLRWLDPFISLMEAPLVR